MPPFIHFFASPSPLAPVPTLPLLLFLSPPLPLRLSSVVSHLSLIPADMEFVKTFLFTYQSFVTPEMLLRKLIERYNVVRPEGMSLKEFAVFRHTIQARVINTLRLWVDLSGDFKGIHCRAQ